MIVSEHIVRFKASRSSGPGGQRLNKRATKVHMWVKVEDLLLSLEQKKLVREKLTHHLNHKDELWVECQEERFQGLNKEKALEHLNAMIEEAIAVPLPRIPTEPPRFVEDVRIMEKKLHQRKKKARGKIDDEEEIGHSI